MIVEGSRILRVSIFNTSHNNLRFVNFSLLPIDVMTIADEVDSQLNQTIASFAESEDSIAARHTNEDSVGENIPGGQAQSGPM
jgi:hypothetical protein